MMKKKKRLTRVCVDRIDARADAAPFRRRPQGVGCRWRRLARFTERTEGAARGAAVPGVLRRAVLYARRATAATAAATKGTAIGKERQRAQRGAVWARTFVHG